MGTATSQKRTPASKAAGRAQDALTILKAEHRAVEKLFSSFENAGDRAYKTKRRLVDQMIDALSVHAFIEEQVLYPAARIDVASADDDVLEALEEHHIVKWELQELLDLDPEDERFVAKVTVLTENVRHHVKEEEGELFPLLRSKLSKARLQELGSKLEKARAVAPHRPHPRLPAGPPEHLLPDAVSSVIDRAREAVKSVRSAS
jgi:hemerythrin-like domain-containing protein